MTWYRVGPAGIPGSLKTDMNTILNKKFGTTGQDYPPADWPADVNLMGPLPVKTASGAIASFSDGADDVPVKSCVVSFLPSGGGGTPSSPVAIQGVSGVAVTQLGKNLLDASSVFNNSTYYEVASDGTITIKASDGRAWASITDEYFIKAGTYTLSRQNTGEGIADIRFKSENYGTGHTIYSARTSVTFTLAEDTYFKIKVGYSADSYPFTSKYQIEVGSDATTFSKYVNPSVVTDTFGQTIYGGSRDLVTDKASVGYVVKNARDYTWTTITQGSDLFFVTVDEALKATGQSATFLCNRFTTINTSAYLPATPTNNTMYHASAKYYNINVFSDVASNITEWNTYIQNNDVEFTIPLATPTELTGLTPHEIDTLLGDNNFYADTGDTSVEYRADIQLALNA